MNSTDERVIRLEMEVERIASEMKTTTKIQNEANTGLKGEIVKLEERVRALEKAVYIGFGAVATIQVALQVLLK